MTNKQNDISPSKDSSALASYHSEVFYSYLYLSKCAMKADQAGGMPSLWCLHMLFCHDAGYLFQQSNCYVYLTFEILCAYFRLVLTCEIKVLFLYACCSLSSIPLWSLRF